MFQGIMTTEGAFEEAGCRKAFPGVLVVDQKGAILFLNQTAVECLERIGSAEMRPAPNRREGLASIVLELLAEWQKEDLRPVENVSVHRVSIGSERILFRLLELRPGTGRPASRHRLIVIEKIS